MENTVLPWVEWVLIVVVLLDVVVRLYKTFTKQRKENDKTESYSEQNNSKSDESNSEVHIDVDEKGNKNFHTRSLVLQALDNMYLKCLSLTTNEKTNLVMFNYFGTNFVMEVRDDRRVAYIIYPSFMELEANEQNRFLLHKALNEFNSRPVVLHTFFTEEGDKIKVRGRTHIKLFYDFDDFSDCFESTLLKCIDNCFDFLKCFNDLSKVSNTNS